jgi:hypothetical protein
MRETKEEKLIAKTMIYQMVQLFLDRERFMNI